MYSQCDALSVSKTADVPEQNYDEPASEALKTGQDSFIYYVILIYRFVEETCIQK